MLLRITTFTLIRVYDTGERFAISNMADLMEFYYFKSDYYKTYPLEVLHREVPNGYLLANSFGVSDAVVMAREKFNCDNILVFIDHHKKYTDLWHFGGDADNHNLVNMYFQNLKYLQKFMWHFKESAQDIILLNELNKMKLVDYESHYEKMKFNFQENLKKMSNQAPLPPIKRYIVDKGVHVSQREIECASWCLKGKSAEETGVILGISKKTVEVHLANLKKKFNCFKQSELTYKLSKLGVLNL